MLTPCKLSTDEENAVYDTVYALELARDVVISIVFYSADEWDTDLVRSSPYYQNVTREGVSL